MKRTAISRILGGLLVAGWLCLPTVAEACTVCMGDPASKSAGAINAAMMLMIGFIGTMLASFGAFAFYLSRRAAAPVPPYVELDQSMNDEEDFS